jgi:hypothetical protein
MPDPEKRKLSNDLLRLNTVPSARVVNLAPNSSEKEGWAFCTSFSFVAPHVVWPGEYTASTLWVSKCSCRCEEAHGRQESTKKIDVQASVTNPFSEVIRGDNMTLDIQALSLDNLNCFRPCVCGSHSFYLDDKMNWHCSRCKPEHSSDTVRFELDDKPSLMNDRRVKRPTLSRLS